MMMPFTKDDHADLPEDLRPTKRPAYSPSGQPVQPSLFGKLLLGLVALSVVVGFIAPLLQPNHGKTEGTVDATALKNDVDKLKALKGAMKAVKEDHLALIRLDGAIDSSASEGGIFAEEAGAQQVRKALDAAAKDDKVKGVLLIVNSPGGTVGMSQELNYAVKRLKKTKPVVVSVTDMCASGGYYTAVAADKIVVNEGSLIGSIGVIIHATNMKRLLSDKLGIDDMTIKSGKFKDILSQSRPMREDERVLLQKLVDESYQAFLRTVLEGRLDKVAPAEKAALEARLRAFADGRVTNGSDAVKIGIADEVGDWHDAKETLNKLALTFFNLKSDTKLELEPFSTSSDSFLSLLGLSSQGNSPSGMLQTGILGKLGELLSQKPSAESAVALQAVLAQQANTMPSASFVQNHTNQPLWFYQ
ncbi:MAG: signal peptide peptidase SppA [Candidatus Melainabacteria bacterium]|nr:signal peptide peptidase SppA [Candidatus Melainabacteria bacterium]